MLISYISPTILASGLIMVVLFSRLKLKNVRLISLLSPLAFGIYLFQNSPVIWKHLDGMFTFAADKPIAVCVIYVFLFAAAIFASGLLVELVRSRIAKAIKIPSLSQTIVDVIGRIISRIVKYIV